jgi:hypothetical protein
MGKQLDTKSAILSLMIGFPVGVLICILLTEFSFLPLSKQLNLVLSLLFQFPIVMIPVLVLFSYFYWNSGKKIPEYLKKNTVLMSSFYFTLHLNLRIFSLFFFITFLIEFAFTSISKSTTFSAVILSGFLCVVFTLISTFTWGFWIVKIIKNSSGK